MIIFFLKIKFVIEKEDYEESEFFDLNKREFLTFFPLILGTLVIGLVPDIFLAPMHMSVNTLIELMYF